MFVSIDLSISQCSLTKSDRFNNRNDIFLSGFSDSILQFIAERGNDGQLLHVENIDNAHNLNKTVESKNDTELITKQSKISDKSPITTLVPHWRTVRVFISSTFKDMHAERDLLTRYVFPELRQRAKSLFVNLYQTDLRWGIAESQSKQSVFLCLNEVYRSDYFIGLIGERYGYIPTSYDVPKDDQRYTWLDKVPIGYSITDLEIQAGALNSSLIKQNRAFFYFRNPQFLSTIPKPWSDDFLSEDDDSKFKINNLKQRIRSSGFETFDGYPCSWQGVSNDRPLVNNLEEFAQRVIENLWTSLQEEYKPEYILLDDNQIEDNQHKQYRLSFLEHFVSRNKILQDTIKSIGKSSIILLTGQQGSGKTAAIAAIGNKILSRTDLNIKLYEHYVGITRSSLNSISMLRRLLCQMINDHSELINQYPIEQIRTSNYIDLCKILADFCRMRTNPSNIVICIDGIELLDNETLVQTLNFIPKDFNFDKITFILTATEDNQVEQACKNLSNVLTINLSNLELLERSEIVRKHLDRFGKKLDEQAFSSQMKFITSKRDSFKPSYLTLICEELLLMTDYEKKITEKLKTIPQRQNLFLLEIFKRLDILFTETYVANVFGLIYSARQDLTEQELRDLINISFGTNKTLPPSDNFTYPITTTPLQLADFIYNCHILLKPQLYDGPQTVSIASNEIRQIIKTRYIRSNEQQINLYKLLAFYYWSEANGSQWTSMNVKAFEDLPYYLYSANEYQLFSSLLTDLKFIAGKCRVGLVQSLIDDYELIKTSSIITQTSSINKTKLISLINTKDRQINEIYLQQYRSFIQRNSHILAVNPSLIYQQALNELETSPVFDNIQQIISNHQKNEQITAFVRVNKQDNMEQIKYSIEDFSEPIRCLAISPSGLYLAAGSADCLVRLYNTSTSRLLKLFVGHAAPISALCFAGNERLISGSNDGGLSIWDVTNGHRLHILSPTHDKKVSELCSNQRGTQFASVSWDSFVRIWDIQKGRKETEIRLHPKPVSSVAFHPDGFMLVTGCWDGIVRQWNVANGQRKSVMRGHLSSIKAVAYSADGRYIASCSIDGECRLWNSLVGSQVGLISARISSIYFSPSGSTLASAGNDGRVRVFSSTIGQCQMIIRNETWGSVSSIIIHPEGEFIIAGYHSGSIRIFDIQNGTTEQELHYHKGRIHRLGFSSSSSGKVLVSASADSFSRIYDIKDLGKRTDLRIQTTILKGHTAGVLSCAMNKLNMIATGSEDATICFYKPTKLFDQSSLEPNDILIQHRTPITGLTFNNETHQLISASRDGQVHIWNINRHASSEILTLANTLAHCHADWINDIALSNTNNGLLVTASNDNTLKIWNTIPKVTNTRNDDDDKMDIVSANVEEARVTLRGHQGSVNTVCFAYGCVVSGSLDNTIRIWSHKGTEITCLRGHTEKVTSCDLWVKLKGAVIKNEIDADNNSKWSNIVDEQELELSRSTHTIDKMLVVSASEDNSIRIWRPTDPEQRCVYDAHAQPLNDIVVSSESIVTSSLDKTIRSWQIPTNAFLNNDSTTSVMTPQITEPNSHLDEITSIAVSKDSSLVFTVSRDAYLFIWSLLSSSSSSQNDDYDMDTDIKKTKMSKQPFYIIQSIKAHDETILGMGLIRSDSSNHILVTGSVDKTIKFWTISNNLNENKCAIKRLKTETTINGPVSFISGQYDMPYFVIGENQSFDSLTFHLYLSSSLERLKTYKTQTCQWPLSSLLTLNEHKHCILTIGSTSNELCSYDLSLIHSTDSKLYVSYASTIEYKTSFPLEWITSIENLDNNQMFYLGTTTGNIYSTSNLFNNINTWNKNQLSSKQRSITGLCSINNEFIFTSGYDNVIRVQHRNDYSKTMMNKDEQEILGQYPVPAPITQMRTWKQQNNGIFGVVAGDTLGNLYLIQWYSS
jgi:telomerase protein component 1